MRSNIQGIQDIIQYGPASVRWTLFAKVSYRHPEDNAPRDFTVEFSGNRLEASLWLDTIETMGSHQTACIIRVSISPYLDPPKSDDSSLEELRRKLTGV